MPKAELCEVFGITTESVFLGGKILPRMHPFSYHFTQ